MNLENGLEEEDIEVQDKEDYTDKKVKQRILNGREMLQSAEHELWSKRLVEPDAEYSELDALLSWGTLVRSYLRDLSVLLNHDGMANAKHYREQVEIGQVRLIPPDKHGYPFSRVAYPDIDADELLKTTEFHDFERGAEMPTPKVRKFNGLQSLITANKSVIGRWTVTKNPMQAEPNQKTIYLEAERPIPKYIYENALTHADQFLQQSGIGLDIEASDYTGEGGPGL